MIKKTILKHLQILLDQLTSINYRSSGLLDVPTFFNRPIQGPDVIAFNTALRAVCNWQAVSWHLNSPRWIWPRYSKQISLGRAKSFSFVVVVVVVHLFYCFVVFLVTLWGCEHLKVSSVRSLLDDIIGTWWSVPWPNEIILFALCPQWTHFSMSSFVYCLHLCIHVCMIWWQHPTVSWTYM